MQTNYFIKDKILILDFGSQYTQLVARRVRELNTYCEVVNWDISKEDLQKFNPKGIILTGGPSSTTVEGSPFVHDHVLNYGVPVLGICYGMQTMAKQLGGQTIKAEAGEFGKTVVHVLSEHKLLKNISTTDTLEMWMSHEDRVKEIPEGFTNIAYTEDCEYVVMVNDAADLYAIQFHPEATHSKNGTILFKNFLDICQCEASWNTSNIIDIAVNNIREQVGDEKVILALSGGVDSSVSAMLLHKAIGDNLLCVFINNGLLRHNEATDVLKMFEQLDLNLEYVDASNTFLQNLAGVTEPEQKRKVIGKTFIDIFDKVSKEHQDIKFLAQGTIYPDVIESERKGKHGAIKSHHNVGGLPKEMKLQLVEPLRQLFKDEVRKIGALMGLDKVFLERHPFPGPGLAVRVLGEIKEEYLAVLRKADHIFIEELRKANLYTKVSQAFVVFLGVKSVSVVGDFRRYGWVVSLRAVNTIDFMTASHSHLDHNFLELVSGRIINEVQEISRVVYDVSSKPPATIEWE